MGRRTRQLTCCARSQQMRLEVGVLKQQLGGAMGGRLRYVNPQGCVPLPLLHAAGSPKARPARHTCTPTPCRPATACPYRSFYGDPIPGHVLAERLGTHVHLYNLYWCAGVLGRLVSCFTSCVDGVVCRQQLAGRKHAVQHVNRAVPPSNCSTTLPPSPPSFACPPHSLRLACHHPATQSGMCDHTACPRCWRHTARRGRSCTWWSPAAPHT